MGDPIILRSMDHDCCYFLQLETQGVPFAWQVKTRSVTVIFHIKQAVCLCLMVVGLFMLVALSFFSPHG